MTFIGIDKDRMIKKNSTNKEQTGFISRSPNYDFVEPAQDIESDHEVNQPVEVRPRHEFMPGNPTADKKD